MRKNLALSKNLEDFIVQLAKHEEINQFPNLTPSRAGDIAKNILAGSDFYIQNPDEETPWNDPLMRQAQAFYFLPLNYLRAKQVCLEAEKVGFFAGLEQLVDFGTGLGAASFAIAESLPLAVHIMVEHSPEPREILKLAQSFLNFEIQDEHGFQKRKNIGHKTLTCFSYSLTEQTEFPSWALDSEALMIIEPSTQTVGRKLLETRNFLLQNGYQIWAPCLHQLNCPLLIHSKKDWCHDRVAYKQPDWFKKIETHLPMKNQTITWSYLLARKTAAPKHQPNTARVTGDMLPEKGKTRQLICRHDEREFLAWMHKNTEPQEIPRGVVIEIPSDSAKVSNEIRVTQMIKEGQ